jgi:hypothetical protein
LTESRTNVRRKRRHKKRKHREKHEDTPYPFLFYGILFWIRVYPCQSEANKKDSSRFTMPKPVSTLLLADAAINFALGVLLLAFSRPLADLLGVPFTDVRFYPTLLGAVLFGIGIALVMEALGQPKNLAGLGLGGAVAINLSGGIVLLVWLLSGALDLPVRGLVFLWSLAVLLVGISSIELLVHFRKPPSDPAG